MLGLLPRIPLLKRMVVWLSLVSLTAFSQGHGADFGGGNFGSASGNASVGTGQGGKMTPMEYVAATRAINQNFDTQAREQQAAMVQANNDMAECALQDISNQNNANSNYGYGNDGKIPGQEQSPWANAAQAALPGLMQSAPQMQEALGGRKQELEKENARIADNYNEGAQTLATQMRGAGVATTAPRLDKDGNETGSTSTLASNCLRVRAQPGDSFNAQTCMLMADNLRQEKAQAQAQISKNKAQISNASSLLWGIGTSLVSGALAYFTTSKANEQAEDANKLAKEGQQKQSNLARKICEMNAQQAYNLAKQNLASINNNRKNALGDLAMAASMPGVVNDKEPEDTAVPVDENKAVVGPQIAVADASPLEEKDNPLLTAANENPAAESPASSGGGAGGGSSGGVSPPPSTFGGPPGPDRAGLPVSSGAKTATVSGAGGIIPLGSDANGFMDPYAGFGMASSGPDAGEMGRAPASMTVGDGGLVKLLVMARRRYSAHAGDLVKSLNVTEIAQNAKPAALRKAASEKSPAPDLMK